MKCHLVVGDGPWPVHTVLHRALSEAAPRTLLVLDLQGRGATLLDAAMRRGLQGRVSAWFDLADRRAPRAPWRYRPTDAHDRALRHLLLGWVACLEGEASAPAIDAIVSATRALATLVQGPSPTLPSWSLVDIVRAMRSPPPLLLARLEGASVVDASSLRPILDALSVALRYPAVFAAVTSPESLPPDGAEGVVWVELARAHLEPVEWQLLARLAGAAAITACAASTRAVDVLVLDPARGVGTRVDPRDFTGASAVSAAWTPLGDGAEAVLRPWSEVGAAVWIGPNRLPLPVWGRCLPPAAFRALGSLEADEMIATRMQPDAAWARRRVRRDDATDLVPRGVHRRHEGAAVHLADAAIEALRIHTPTRGLLSRIASLPLLRRAWHRLNSVNPNLSGTDFVTARTFGAELEPSLRTLRAELLDGTYRPLPLRRVNIPKEDGSVRAIGIVTVRDRIVQTACLEVIDPLLDATFSDHSYAYRVRRGAPLAVLAAMDAVREGARWLVRCDVAKCFDSLDHAILFARLREVFDDDELLHLLGLWARADILVGEDLIPTEVGVAQGTVLAPLLCNLYLTPLDRALEAAEVTFIRYADDILLCAPDEAAAREALALTERTLAGPLRLRLNPKKTQVVPTAEGLDHLGFRLSAEGLDVQAAKMDKLLEEVRRRLGEVVRVSTEGDAAVRESFAGILAVLRGFAAYYESVGEAPRVQASLARLGRAVHALSLDVLPPGLFDHPAWKRRSALWRGEVPEPKLAAPPPAGLYAEPRTKAVTPPSRREEDRPAATVAPRAEDDEAQAPGVLLDDGNLQVLRHGVYLTLRGDALVLRARGVDLDKVALHQLRTVSVSGHGTTLSAALARWVSRAGVPLLLGTPTDTEYTLIASPSPGVPRVRAAQAIGRERPELVRAGLAMLHGKIAGQASILRYYAKYRRRCADPLHKVLDEAAMRIREAAERVLRVPTEGWDTQRKVAMGHEGFGAALYWEAVAQMVPPELDFSARCTRGASDPLNQSLNYAYGRLYVEVWKAVQQAGLDPYLGIIHGSERGDPSLVFDLVEELRPNFADRLIFSLLGRGFRPKLGARGTLSTTCRRLISRAFHRSASRGARWCGSPKSLSKIAQGQARTLRAIVLGEASVYRAFHLRW